MDDICKEIKESQRVIKDGYTEVFLTVKLFWFLTEIYYYLDNRRFDVVLKDKINVIYKHSYRGRDRKL